MADPRQTGFLDDFQRADDYPLSWDGRWQVLRQDNAGCPLWLHENSVEIHTISGQSTQADYWYQPFAGNVEVWGICDSNCDLREGLRLYLHITNPYKPPAVHEGEWSGYILDWNQDILGMGGSLLRRDNESTVESLGSYSGVGRDAYMLRTVGDQVEYWGADQPLTEWELMLSATDNTYRYGYIGLGTRQDDHNPSWLGFGGGPLRRSQIYRWISG